MIAQGKNILRIVSLLLLDLAAYYGSLMLAFYTRKGLNFVFHDLIPLHFTLSYFLDIWWMPVVVISFIAYERLYIKNLPFWDETKELIQSISVSMVVILAIITLGKMTDSISRLTVMLLWLYGVLVFPFFRLAGKKILYALGIWRENVIIIGAGRAGVETAKGINSDIHLGYHVIGFLDDADEKIGTEIEINGGKYKVFGKTKNFNKFVSLLNISTIVIAIPSISVERLSEITNTVQRYAKKVLLIPDLKGIALLNTELYHLFMQQLFLLKINNNLKSPVNRLIKMTFDLAVSLLLLPLLLLVIGVIGTLIKLDSPGPVLYSHPRIGRRGNSFQVYKFRTMYVDSRERLETILRTDPRARREWETYFKLKRDPRITRVGEFLRKTSLDELPQIFNVLKGEMSLVGPRPVLKEEIDKYYREYADYYYMVRPGITGLWQVSGRNDIDYEFRVRLDVWYALNWSVWLDTLMLFKTFKVVLKKEGAY